MWRGQDGGHWIGTIDPVNIENKLYWLFMERKGYWTPTNERPDETSVHRLYNFKVALNHKTMELTFPERKKALRFFKRWHFFIALC